MTKKKITRIKIKVYEKLLPGELLDLETIGATYELKNNDVYRISYVNL